MKKVLFALLILIFLFTEISALCENGQININSASLEELDGLSGIGPVKAQAIIDARPFNSVDSLIDVTGIGNATLYKIKTQGLACVIEEESVSVEKPKDIINEKNSSINNKKVDANESGNYNIIITEPSIQYAPMTSEEVKTIVLTSVPKDIKSETDKEQLNKNKLAIYGLVVFCLLLALLFIFKRKNKKNEFE